MKNDFTNHIRTIVQKMRTQKIRKEAFARLEQLRKKGTVTDGDTELTSYRQEKYSK